MFTTLALVGDLPGSRLSAVAAKLYPARYPHHFSPIDDPDTVQRLPSM
ncbi:MAG: hypothetical protein QOI06_3532 [Nocardioidaceae bacterium]|jgi:hypothetical protein|nr:hypothetical protein [Nocardioidaceae bacterium]